MPDVPGGGGGGAVDFGGGGVSVFGGGGVEGGGGGGVDGGGGGGAVPVVAGVFSGQISGSGFNPFSLMQSQYFCRASSIFVFSFSASCSLNRPAQFFWDRYSSFSRSQGGRGGGPSRCRG